MKKAVFIVFMITGIAFKGMAAPAIKEVTAILPYMNTAQQVDEKLGSPERVDKSLGQMIWYYTGKGFSLAVMWDMQTSKVTKYSFTSIEGRPDEWSADNAKHLVTNETTLENVISAFGTPNDVSADRGKYQVQYIYKNNIIRLSFLDGKLKNYAVSATK